MFFAGESDSNSHVERRAVSSAPVMSVPLTTEALDGAAGRVKHSGRPTPCVMPHHVDYATFTCTLGRQTEFLRFLLVVVTKILSLSGQKCQLVNE